MKIVTFNKIIRVLAVAVGIAFAVLIISNINERSMVKNKEKFKQLGIELSAASDFLTEHARHYALYGEKKHYDAYWDEVNNKKNLERVISEIKALGAQPNELALVEKAAALSNTLAQLEGQAFDAVAVGDMETAQSLMFGEAYDRGKTPIIETMDEFQSAVQGRTQRAVNAAELTANISLVVFGLILMGAAVIIHIFFRGILGSLRDIVGKLEESMSGIEISSRQMAKSSANLSQGSSGQAANIEETSATMNETSSMISQNVENTRLAAQLASEATSTADKGMKEMRNMMHSMDELKESSDKVSRIVKTIDDIAFQTNLLAINATVEAARAGGDAGRSFSVVAEEVRNLAQKSARAVSDTTQIIEKNIALTNSGRDVSQEVSASLEEITEKNNHLNKLIAEINAASEEQTSGVKQINVAINQIEKNTQENAAVAQENSDSAEKLLASFDNLNSIANRLSAMI